VFADAGNTITCAVTAFNTGGGSTPSVSNPTATIIPLAPTNSAAPIISGTATEGQTLSVTTGTWSGSPTYTYVWRRNGIAISGATSSTYVLVTADVGSTITCTVTATNAGGSSNSTSAPTSTVVPLAPVNSVSPVISGTAAEGQTLTVSNGTWSGSPTYTYQWRRAGTAISGATTSAYLLISSDVGTVITCTVTATNAGGSNAATTAGTSVVVPLAPTNSSAPVISGTSIEGQTLTVSSLGAWTGSPTYAYQWRRNGSVISGATGVSYILVTADNGLVITCTVTATNAGGSTSATSNGIGPINSLAGIPTNSVAPVASGAPFVDEVLTASTGTWTGSPTYTYQWRSGGTPISGATSSSYTVVVGDIGTNITCTVTATNGSGSVSVTSNSIGVIAAYTPSMNFSSPRNSQYLF
jgi:hypothetical protein